MATDDDVLQVQRDLGRLEGTVEAQGERLDELGAKFDAHNRATSEKLDRILAYQERQKGGARALVFAGSIAGSLFGALAALVLEWIKSPPSHP
jgi:hypothetical protein